jgi:hypothetical protein
MAATPRGACRHVCRGAATTTILAIRPGSRLPMDAAIDRAEADWAGDRERCAAVVTGGGAALNGGSLVAR